ncbi:TetR/AcrR family transcriptional regulator [Streptomyces diacarni]|uniref:TetR/AcrR family transcriptional regulator n=1 Tax=Streptomyces diacarni TaxID=2800381 RepID=A0A367ESR8_9ACTN|nr:TetR/AcrR family transcriptional regulator [Streptomyces diacarni]RCG20759.1 TetR/AcrR family transcriptional regulator [Streptomyces diacarni]
MTPQPTRTRILDAAHALMRSEGLLRTTTKEIAKAAGCSEAALYKHFASKEELFIGVLSERLPRLGATLERLRGDPGAGTVEENLAEVARHAAVFYAETFPIAASLFADRRLKDRHERAMRERGVGPHVPISRLDAYLRAEQEAGRIRADADTYTAAALLMGACAHRAFAYGAVDGPPAPLEDFAATLARTVLDGIG